MFSENTLPRDRNITCQASHLNLDKLIFWSFQKGGKEGDYRGYLGGLSEFKILSKILNIWHILAHFAC